MTRALTLRRLPASVSFGAAAAAVVAACLAAARAARGTPGADVAAWGMTVDFAVSIPLLYGWLVVRRGKAPAITMAPVFLAGLFAARRLGLPEAQPFVRQLAFVSAAAEAALLVFLVRRAMRAARAMRGPTDPAEALAAASEALLGRGRPAEIVASEASFLYFALWGWRREPDVPPGSTAVTVHRTSGWGSMLFGIVVLIVAEGLGVHLFLRDRSLAAAWAFTALDLYSIVWLFGDYQAMRLRPILASPGRLRLRWGLRWNAELALESITRIERLSPGDSPRRRPRTLRIAALEEPQYRIILAERIAARGVFGIRKSISAVDLHVDEPAIFESLLPPF